MGIHIDLLSIKDAQELLEFELANKEYFERGLPPRGASYYNLENMKSIISEIDEEQKQGLCYMYLIRDTNDEVVGRVNIFSVVRSIFQSCEIGYRIGEKHTGKGYGTKAVKLACDEAFKTHKLHRIEAGTAPDNIGSQIVLIKNGFQFIGRASKVIRINDNWVDSVMFERINSELYE